LLTVCVGAILRMMIYVSYFLLWILSMSPRIDAPAPQGTWRREVRWNKPPANFGLNNAMLV
jgi:hypothetical protein